MILERDRGTLPGHEELIHEAGEEADRDEQHDPVAATCADQISPGERHDRDGNSGVHEVQRIGGAISVTNTMPPAAQPTRRSGHDRGGDRGGARPGCAADAHPTAGQGQEVTSVIESMTGAPFVHDQLLDGFEDCRRAVRIGARAICA
jgi:hypothetical protein